MTAHPLFDIGDGSRWSPAPAGASDWRRPAGCFGPAAQSSSTAGTRTRLAEAASGLTGDVHTAVFDVTDGPSVAAGIAEVEERVGPLDILVNNAGMQLRAPLLEFTDADWHRVLDTHLTSAFLVGREAARRMTERGHGKIINICSPQSEVARPGIAPYAATKGALKMLTKGMCADWGPHGVQVNGLGPGCIETEPTRPLVEDQEFSAWVRRRTRPDAGAARRRLGRRAAWRVRCRHSVQVAMAVVTPQGARGRTRSARP
ncbi:gluconate 5-dehydrogenase [Streptomyces chromofuscus]|nr:gluconate 5-dehydrogenase [Streptomyces chromofuscus]